MWQRLGELWMVGEVDVIQCQPGWQAPWQGAGDTMLRSGSYPWTCAELPVWGPRFCTVFTTCAHCASALCTLGTWPPEPFLIIFDFVQHQGFPASVY